MAGIRGEEPSGWCAECDEVLTAIGGDWTDEACTAANIKLVCVECFASLRERHLIEA
jgi:hypothetical protein